MNFLFKIELIVTKVFEIKKKKPKTDESEYESSYIISSNCYKLFKNYIWRYASKLDVLLLSGILNIKTDFSNELKTKF